MPNKPTRTKLYLIEKLAFTVNKIKPMKLLRITFKFLSMIVKLYTTVLEVTFASKPF
jgi:hypothetical protein